MAPHDAPTQDRCPKARNLKTSSAAFFVALAALCLSAHAGEVVVPVVPPPVHFDTESVTNAPLLRPMMDRARVFRHYGSVREKTVEGGVATNAVPYTDIKTIE